MSELLQVILLGIIEGITEFLPISSTGHLIVAADLLNFKDPGGTFEIVIQLGAVLAVIWFYRRDLFERVRLLTSDRNVRKFWINLLIAFIPAAVCGFLFEKFLTTYLFSTLVVAISLIAGGLILWFIDKPSIPDDLTQRHEAAASENRLNKVTILQAAIIGFVQITALIPGVSRSGSSIVGGLLVGLDRETATAFSFYLAIPTLGGATVYKLLKSSNQIVEQGASLDILIGSVVAFVSALLVVGWLLRYIAHHNFRGFALYRIAAGIALLCWLSLR